MEKNSQSLKVDIPSQMVGRVIGKGGQKIQSLQQQSGASIKIQTKESQPFAIIRGTPDQVKNAAKLINYIVNNQINVYAHPLEYSYIVFPKLADNAQQTVALRPFTKKVQLIKQGSSLFSIDNSSLLQSRNGNEVSDIIDSFNKNLVLKGKSDFESSADEQLKLVTKKCKHIEDLVNVTISFGKFLFYRKHNQMEIPSKMALAELIKKASMSPPALSSFFHNNFYNKEAIMQSLGNLIKPASHETHDILTIQLLLVDEKDGEYFMKYQKASGKFELREFSKQKLKHCFVNMLGCQEHWDARLYLKSYPKPPLEADKLEKMIQIDDAAQSVTSQSAQYRVKEFRFIKREVHETVVPGVILILDHVKSTEAGSHFELEIVDADLQDRFDGKKYADKVLEDKMRGLMKFAELLSSKHAPFL